MEVGLDALDDLTRVLIESILFSAFAVSARSHRQIPFRTNARTTSAVCIRHLGRRPCGEGERERGRQGRRENKKRSVGPSAAGLAGQTSVLGRARGASVVLQNSKHELKQTMDQPPITPRMHSGRSGQTANICKQLQARETHPTAHICRNPPVAHNFKDLTEITTKHGGKTSARRPIFRECSKAPCAADDRLLA